MAAAVTAAAALAGISCQLGQTVQPAPPAAGSDCARCHVQIHADWAASLHAAAARDPRYVSARATLDAEPAAEQCLRCHSPKLAAEPADAKQRERLAADAVDCAACHAANPADPQSAAVMRGPYEDCDTAAHGCRQDASMATAASCKACHELNGPMAGPAGGQSFGMFTTFSELALSRRGKAGANCLDCHMAAAPGRDSIDGPLRPAVNSHRLDGAASERALRHALDGRLETFWADEQLEIVLSLTNTGGGHHVPTGLPGRRIEVALAAYDKDGGVLDRQQWWLGRVLAGEASDEPVPFFRATRSVGDNRLAAEQTRRFRLYADRARTARVTAEVRYYPLDPAIARQLGAAEQPVEVLSFEKSLP